MNKVPKYIGIVVKKVHFHGSLDTYFCLLDVNTMHLSIGTAMRMHAPLCEMVFNV